MFFNIGLETNKRDLIRAVLEGVAYHKRWMLETIEKKIPHRDSLRFVGGGAQSGIWGQILADITGRQIEVTANAQNAGAIGAAIVCAVGLGLFSSFQDASPLIRVARVFTPRPEYQDLYERQFLVYKQLYPNTASCFIL
jgi:xylulokinase